MTYFSHEGIQKLANDLDEGKTLNPSAIEQYYNYCDLDKLPINSEIETLSRIYKITYKEINIFDLLQTSENMTLQEDDVSKSEAEGDCCDNGCEKEKEDKNKSIKVILTN